MSSEQTSSARSSFVSPDNTALPAHFFHSYNISSLHVQLNNTPDDDIDDNSGSQSPLPKLDLFQDLHDDHNLETNKELMYESLFQASQHVPGWKSLPFEVFVNMVEIKPLLGGFSNFLVSLELKPEYLTHPELQETRPTTLKQIIAEIETTISCDDDLNVPILSNPSLFRPLVDDPYTPPLTPPSPTKPLEQIHNNDTIDVSLNILSPIAPETASVLAPALDSIASESGGQVPSFIPVAGLTLPVDIKDLDLEAEDFIYIKPSITRVCLRIYGTSEFTNRSIELGLAKAASDKDISEHVYCSWRHGRITSYIDGSSLGPLKWNDPILSSTCAYIQGQLHAANFLSCFQGTSLPVPPIDKPQLHDMLKNWCHKSFNTTLYKKSLAHSSPIPRISSVFDMFTAKDCDLYVINRPASAVKTKSIRCSSLILPLPPKLEFVTLPLLNAYQIDTLESEDCESSHFTYPHRSERMQPLESFQCVKDGVLQLTPLNPEQTSNINPYNDTIAQKQATSHPNGSTINVHNYTIPIPTSRVLNQEQSELILEYLDLPKMKKEIYWLLDQCKLFPIVTSHNDFHSGNVLLLNKLLQTKLNGPTTHNFDGHVISLPTPASDTTLTVTTQSQSSLTTTTPDSSISHSKLYSESSSFPFPLDSEKQPLPLPNQSSDWIKVIDMEYGGFNYRGYDTANSSNESWIVYDGSHPGFTLDLPGWISTAFLGIYDPEVAKLKETDPDVEPYKCFDHCHLPTIYDQNRLDQIIQVWNQQGDEKIGATIQHIILGSHASKPVNIEECPKPAFRPREVMWAEACLTGFYHATKQHHYRTHHDPENTPIYPFQTTLPIPQPGFNPDYVLPATIEEWLADQTPKLLYETMILQFASMLAWSVWGITFTEGSVAEGFGYLEHALARMIAYVAKKEVLIKMGLLQKQ